MTRNTPIFPGAMTPAQIAEKVLNLMLSVLIVAVTIATLTATFILTN